MRAHRGNKKAGPTRFFIARRLFIHVVLGLAELASPCEIQRLKVKWRYLRTRTLDAISIPGA